MAVIYIHSRLFVPILNNHIVAKISFFFPLGSHYTYVILCSSLKILMAIVQLMQQQHNLNLDNFHILVQSGIHKLCTRTYFYITLMMYYDVFKVDKALEPSVLLFSEM